MQGTQLRTPTSSFYEIKTVSSLKIITWNIWFEEFEQVIRYQEILSICSSHLPDIICFQEVTIPFLHILAKWEELKEYCCSDGEELNGLTLGHYGVLTLVKRKYFPTFSFHQFPVTNMGRRLLVSKLLLRQPMDKSDPGSIQSSTKRRRCSSSPSTFNWEMMMHEEFDDNCSQGNSYSMGPPSYMSVTTIQEEREESGTVEFYIGNVHLESLEYHSIREQQLLYCSQVLSPFPYYLLVGDFNFCSYTNRSPGCTSANELHNNSLYQCFPTIVDLWSQQRPNSPGYTIDGTMNQLLESKQKLVRYDRICYSFQIPKQIDQCKSSSRSANKENEPPSDFPVDDGPFDLDSMLVNSKRTSQQLVIKPKAIHLIGNEPIVQRRLIDPINAIRNGNSSSSNRMQQLLFTPPTLDRPYRSVYNRQVIEVFPSDHFGLCGSFELDWQ